MESAVACRVVLKLLASPPAAGMAPVPVVDLAERALRTVQGNALQSTRIMTWNICGEEKAVLAPADFTLSDKMGWLRAELELLQPEILALQECPQRGRSAVLVSFVYFGRHRQGARRLCPFVCSEQSCHAGEEDGGNEA